MVIWCPKQTRADWLTDWRLSSLVFCLGPWRHRCECECYLHRTVRTGIVLPGLRWNFSSLLPVVFSLLTPPACMHTRWLPGRAEISRCCCVRLFLDIHFVSFFVWNMLGSMEPCGLDVYVFACDGGPYWSVRALIHVVVLLCGLPVSFHSIFPLSQCPIELKKCSFSEWKECWLELGAVQINQHLFAMAQWSNNAKRREQQQPRCSFDSNTGNVACLRLIIECWLDNRNNLSSKTKILFNLMFASRARTHQIGVLVNSNTSGLAATVETFGPSCASWIHPVFESHSQCKLLLCFESQFLKTETFHCSKNAVVVFVVVAISSSQSSSPFFLLASPREFW